jgi:SET domain-containing protein
MTDPSAWIRLKAGGTQVRLARMLLIPTHLGPSAIHGLGVFTSHAVPAGTPVWRFEPGWDQAIDPATARDWPAAVRDFLDFYAYREAESGRYVLNGDHGRHMNHAAIPTTGAPGGVDHPAFTVALRDLAAGEELTCNYRMFDADAERKLGPAS